MNRLTNGNTVLAPANTDKSKDWQLELLMEKLRSKASQFKTFSETSKNVRMAMLDKRYALDSVEKSQHQKCLDTLQQSIKVTSLQRMVEKLECLTRQLGLKFVVGQSGVELFISSDMFYLEIILEQSGAVKDVKVHHDSKVEQQSCAELVSCLSRGDFADFTAQLEGFASIYQLNAEKKIKCKAFIALQSLEADLSTLAQLQTFMKEPFNLLHKSPVGILEKRRGGHPMKLTYFVSPYDLIDVDKYDLDPISVETVTSKSVGYSVTVCMEGSAAHKLQTTTLITVNRNLNGKNTPSSSNLNNQNSAAIPGCFVLKLNKPMPMCVALVKQIQQVTELDCTELSSATHPLLSLIATHASNGKLEGGNNKGLFVTLPDQQHCYFLTENKNMDGILVHSIPFTHPCHVSQILVILRQQALFNTIITSCVRQNSRQDLENMMIFEVSALSWTHISISLEHPIEENMATAEIDLTDISNLVCRIHSPGTPPPPNTPDTASELATRVLNRCFSIPITMRAVIKLWDKQVVRKTHFNGHENFSLPLDSDDPGGHKGGSGGSLTEFGGLEGKMKQEPPGSGLGHGMNLPMMSHSHQGIFLDEQSVLSNMELTNILQGTVSLEKTSKRQHKRKTNEDATWKSAKRKQGDDELLLETSSSDSTSRSTPLSQETVSEIQTPNSALGFHSDLELSGIDALELMETTDKVADFDNMDELGDVEEMLAKGSVRKLQKSPSQSSASLLMDLADAAKSLVTPSVSITPIPSSSSSPSGYAAQSSARTAGGIEIIPISTASSPILPSSITITPISSSQMKSSDEKSREKKSSKTRSSDDKSRLEKKRKRRREESAMGPPGKLPPKQQDPLSKPVSVSIKPAVTNEDVATPTSPGMMRKFSPSPTQARTLSPSIGIKSGLKTTSSGSHHSPKHSPAHMSNSPKHSGIPGLSSPKSHGTSPKHPSISGTGKPSMSTLKNAANSPSSKSSTDPTKSKTINKESSRDKDRKLSSVFSAANCPKVKVSSVKLKQLDLTAMEAAESPNPEGGNAQCDKTGAGVVPGQVRNRKGSLSAVIDKLKSAQHCDTDTKSNRERTGQLSTKNAEGKSAGKTGSSSEMKNSEYMVKPSLDGMKLTINKTRMKESSKSSSKLDPAARSSSSSLKTHTGLKPGVNSGPASKKPQSTLKTNSVAYYGPFKSGKLTPGGGKTPVTSGLNKSSKLGGSPKTNLATSENRIKDRSKTNKSGEKSIFLSREGRKSSPTQSRDDEDKGYKILPPKIDPYSSPLMMDGLTKQLDKNFQIPKLSARATEDRKPPKVPESGVNNVHDAIAKPETKYPLAIPTNKVFDNVETKIRNNMNNAVSVTAVTAAAAAAVTGQKFAQKEQQQTDFVEAKRDAPVAPAPYAVASKSSSSFVNEQQQQALSLTTKLADSPAKFVAPIAPARDDKKDSKAKEGASGGDLTVELSAKPEQRLVGFPQSPSVSVHIVKSPAPSPHSTASPSCITDDELMDEALVGLGK